MPLVLVPGMALTGLSLLVLLRFLRFRQRGRKTAEFRWPGYLEDVRQAEADLRSTRSAFAEVLRKRPHSDVYQHVVTNANAAQLELAFKSMARDIGQAQLRIFPPGCFLIDLAASFCSSKTMERVVVQAISDMQCEHSRALGAKGQGTAAWVRLRGYAGVWTTLALHAADKLFRSFWNK
jgi:hypothetical protein